MKHARAMRAHLTSRLKINPRHLRAPSAPSLRAPSARRLRAPSARRLRAPSARRLRAPSVPYFSRAVRAVSPRAVFTRRVSARRLRVPSAPSPRSARRLRAPSPRAVSPRRLSARRSRHLSAPCAPSFSRAVCFVSPRAACARRVSARGFGGFRLRVGGGRGGGKRGLIFRCDVRCACISRACFKVISVVFAPRRAHSSFRPSVTWGKNVPFIYLARAPWYFGALFLFFALFHATPHALAKWGGQSDNSTFWLNLL